jgi:triosephosphate isomerase
MALTHKLKVVFCFGETLDQRKENKTKAVIEDQLSAIGEAIKTPENWDSVVLAYEPVWAIGTGVNAEDDQVREAHLWIREWLQSKATGKAASVRIIYGGSVTEKNCGSLIKVDNVDGFLVGGASLKKDFIEIVKSADNKYTS